MILKKWVVGDRYDNSDIKREIENICSLKGFSYPMGVLLYNKGLVTKEKIESFFNLSNESFYSPFLLNDMEKACQRIEKAINEGEKICVYGDYDVDGITSTALLYLYLKSIGGDVKYFIPNRQDDGYGVAKNAINRLHDEGITLIVTVDTGVTAVEEIEYSKEVGVDFVITDHHECREVLPQACAVVNPRRPDSNYPFDKLAGVGVAFKTVCALEIYLRKKNGETLDGVLEKLCGDYIDLVAMGTIADVMPLVDENRLIVAMGLKCMQKNRRIGLYALSEIADGKKGSTKEINVSSIAFGIAPRLNAAGRMDSATRAVELFMTANRDEADIIASDLCESNARRRAEEQKIVGEIDKIISDDPSLIDKNVIVLSSENWHHGVIGIVASRLTEKYSKPCILISFDGDMGKGSGRSVVGFNLSDGLAKCSSVLAKYGGHELAAGLSVERCHLDEFIEMINKIAGECTEIATVPEVYADFELRSDEINLKFAEELATLEPCGPGNPTPSFVIRDAVLEELAPIGNGKHTRLKLRKDGRLITALRFGLAPDELGVEVGNTVDVMFTLSVNEYMGNRSEQLIIKEIAPSSGLLETYKNNYSSYCLIKDGKISIDGDMLPTRDDFASVYRALKRAADGSGYINVYRLGTVSGISGYAKLRLAVDILCEASVVTVTESENGINGCEIFKVSIEPNSTKVNLEETCLYKTLKKLLPSMQG